MAQRTQRTQRSPTTPTFDNHKQFIDYIAAEIHPGIAYRAFVTVHPGYANTDCYEADLSYEVAFEQTKEITRRTIGSCLDKGYCYDTSSERDDVDEHLAGFFSELEAKVQGQHPELELVRVGMENVFRLEEICPYDDEDVDEGNLRGPLTYAQEQFPNLSREMAQRAMDGGPL